MVRTRTQPLDQVGAAQLPPRLVEDLAHFKWDGSTLKVDWALSAPVPWKNRAVAGAGTVHACVRAEAPAWRDPLRLIVQAYASRRPIGSVQRSVTHAELQQGVSVEVPHLAAQVAPRVVAWVERGTPDLALILVDGQTYFLKAGDTVTAAWVVAEIKDNSVVLRSGDHVRELQIEGGSQT